MCPAFQHPSLPLFFSPAEIYCRNKQTKRNKFERITFVKAVTEVDPLARIKTALFWKVFHFVFTLKLLINKLALVLGFLLGAHLWPFQWKCGSNSESFGAISGENTEWPSGDSDFSPKPLSNAKTWKCLGLIGKL
jgi:hypothetical protein